MTHRTQESTTYDYSFMIAKGYKLKSAQERDAQGRVQGIPSSSPCGVMGSERYLLLVTKGDSVHRVLPTREAYRAFDVQLSDWGLITRCLVADLPSLAPPGGPARVLVITFSRGLN